MKIIPIIIITFFIPFVAFCQFGYGLTIPYDLYHRYENPENPAAYDAAGSAILNLAVGPKIWVGSKDFSISAEATAGIGFLGLAVKDYKGLGTANLPMLILLNFNGLSGLDSEIRQGFNIGGGIQYTKTELYGLSEKYENLGISRGLYRTYLVHVGYGFGLQGFAAAGFLRYGFNGDEGSNTLSLGVQWDFNFNRLNKIRNKNSEL